MRCLSLLELAGNALDVVVLDTDTVNVIVSLDTVHEPGSTKRWKSEPNPDLKMLQVFKFDSSSTDYTPSLLIEAVDREGTFAIEPRIESSSKSQKPDLGELLYGLENLRKQRQTEDESDR